MEVDRDDDSYTSLCEKRLLLAQERLHSVSVSGAELSPRPVPFAVIAIALAALALALAAVAFALARGKESPDRGADAASFAEKVRAADSGTHGGVGKVRGLKVQ